MVGYLISWDRGGSDRQCPTVNCTGTSKIFASDRKQVSVLPLQLSSSEWSAAIQGAKVYDKDEGRLIIGCNFTFRTGVLDALAFREASTLSSCSLQPIANGKGQALNTDRLQQHVDQNYWLALVGFAGLALLREDRFSSSGARYGIG